jgi:hypothetical protein
MGVTMATRLLFTTKPGPIAGIIRACTWSEYSHVDIVDGDHVIGAYPGRGVERVPLVQRLAECTRADFFVVPDLDSSKAIAEAVAQLTKPYDWAGVVGIGLHRDWQCANKWFCSELVAYVAERCNVPLVHGGYKRVTPQMLINSVRIDRVS